MSNGRTLRRALSAVGLVAVLIIGGAVTTQVGSIRRAAASTPNVLSAGDWLGEINQYRTAAGLPPVLDNPGWDAGILAHDNYLQFTPPGLMSGAYASQHTENPASPYYTAAGATEAAASDILAGAPYTPVHFIDGWLSDPYHAIGMLRPNLTQVAFAANPSGYAGLDVLHGLGPTPAAPPLVLFPANGMTTNLSTEGAEYPDPRETCGWAPGGANPLVGAAGLPLIALLPGAPSPSLSATLTNQDGTVQSSAAGSLCVVDQNHYWSSNAVYGSDGLSILSGNNAVVIIPNSPLIGTYTATISQPGQPNITWSFTAQPQLPAPVVGMANTPDGGGYWLTNSQGLVSYHGDATYYGSISTQTRLAAPITHIVATPDGKGYWLVAADGGTFSFGDAPFLGSMGGKRLNAPVVDIAPTPDGKGYWLIASDGGVFSFGDALFWGSTGNLRLNRPVVGMTAPPDGKGYWLVASDGGIFAFGDAHFRGSTGNLRLNQPVVGMAAAPGGTGYWLVASDGGIFAFGTAGFFGSTGNILLNVPIAGMGTDPATGGYWFVASDGGVFSFDALFLGAD